MMNGCQSRRWVQRAAAALSVLALLGPASAPVALADGGARGGAVKPVQRCRVVQRIPLPHQVVDIIPEGGEVGIIRAVFNCPRAVETGTVTLTINGVGGPATLGELPRPGGRVLVTVEPGAAVGLGPGAYTVRVRSETGVLDTTWTFTVVLRN